MRWEGALLVRLACVGRMKLEGRRGGTEEEPEEEEREGGTPAGTVGTGGGLRGTLWATELPLELEREAATRGAGGGMRGAGGATRLTVATEAEELRELRELLSDPLLRRLPTLLWESTFLRLSARRSTVLLPAAAGLRGRPTVTNWALVFPATG